MNKLVDFLSRRGFLGSSAAGAAMLLPGRNAVARDTVPHSTMSIPVPGYAGPDGPSGPFPIPWLDKNGSHNQPAGPGLEPSHIYHFKGRVARCSGFRGVGSTGNGEQILFGTKTTDYGIMDGVYWAARAPQRGVFSHI